MNSVYQLLFIASAFFIVACGASGKEKKGDLNDKKVQLQKLKNEQVTLTQKIAALEKEIAKLDTSAVVVKAKLVAVSPLVKGEFVHYIDLQGMVDAENVSNVSPRGQGGVVKGIYVKEGDQVRKGQLLIRLDDVVARQQLEQANIQLDYLKDIYQRRKNLWDQSIGTEVELIAARNNVQNQEKNIQLLNEQLNYSNVYAEISGIAEQVTIKLGEFFSPQSAGMSGIRIINTSNLKAVIDVPENYLARVRKGTPVIIEIPDLNKSFNSSITLISQLIGQTSRSFKAEARIPSQPGLKPNLIARVRIQDYKSTDVIVIPVNTLQTDEKGKYVFVLSEEKGKKVARKRPVSVGEMYGNQIEVKAGLSEGEQLVTEGFQGLYEGQVISTEVK